MACRARGGSSSPPARANVCVEARGRARGNRLADVAGFGVQWRQAGAIVLAMNRRTFIQAAGLGFTRHLGLTERGQPIAVLLKLLEDSPRERIARELVRMIRAGLRYEDLLAALSLAAVRNVQPYPDVGFKYHSVMVLRSIHLTTQHLSSADKWFPIVWAADYFKDSQAQEQATSAWRLTTTRAL